MEEIYGIGPVLKVKIEKILNGRNFMKTYKESDIYNLLPESTRAYLKYMPIKCIKRVVIKNTLSQNLEKCGAIISGSYRRGTEYCRDLDILIKREYLDILLNSSDFTPAFVQGDEIIRCFIKIQEVYFFVDIFIYTEENFAAMLLYTTGSKQFNKYMRGIAKKKGYKLNQNGIYQNNILIKTYSEKDIFDILNMKYLEPYERNL